jgi:hypothetical protein
MKMILSHFVSHLSRFSHKLYARDKEMTMRLPARQSAVSVGVPCVVIRMSADSWACRVRVQGMMPQQDQTAMPTPFTDKRKKGNDRISPSPLRDVNIHCLIQLRTDLIRFKP